MHTAACSVSWSAPPARQANITRAKLRKSFSASRLSKAALDKRSEACVAYSDTCQIADALDMCASLENPTEKEVRARGPRIGNADSQRFWADTAGHAHTQRCFAEWGCAKPGATMVNDVVVQCELTARARVLPARPSMLRMCVLVTALSLTRAALTRRPTGRPGGGTVLVARGAAGRAGQRHSQQVSHGGSPKRLLPTEAAPV